MYMKATLDGKRFHDDNITPYNNEGLDIHIVFRILISQLKNIEKILKYYILPLQEKEFSNNVFINVDFDKNKRSCIITLLMYNQEFIPDKSHPIPDEWIHKR